MLDSTECVAFDLLQITGTAVANHSYLGVSLLVT